ncbi:MAG: [Clostridia bacterium]|nr:[FeFe] hydrogenase H-cluster maturation GTPase HydF [Clostridia bacterium]
MSLNAAPSSERLHIGFFGLRNAGKSSLVNAVTGQTLSLVSDVKGTTTDPVKKAMELLPLGPVVIIDTPGIDDEGELGEMRVKRAVQTLNYADIAVLCVDATKGLQAYDAELIERFKKKNIKYIVAYNKSDLLEYIPEAGENEIYVSAVEGTNINELKEMAGRLIKNRDNGRKIVADLVERGDVAVLVVPIDESAPKGRLILPQQQVIRELIENGAMAVVCRDTELEATLSSLAGRPKLVITDSQVFEKVSSVLPEDIPLTSFSILFARYKGDLASVVRGAFQLDKLRDGEKILISEGCTHHRQCNDIGTVKIPGWINKYTGKNLEFEFTSGGEFPENLSDYSLIVHCGGCMLNAREMQYRTGFAADFDVPMTNYGIAIAHMHGILRRSVALFPEVLNAL